MFLRTFLVQQSKRQILMTTYFSNGNYISFQIENHKIIMYYTL